MGCSIEELTHFSLRTYNAIEKIETSKYLVCDECDKKISQLKQNKVYALLAISYTTCDIIYYGSQFKRLSSKLYNYRVVAKIKRRNNEN